MVTLDVSEVISFLKTAIFHLENGNSKSAYNFAQWAADDILAHMTQIPVDRKEISFPS